jgi:hypothetical protein
MLLDQLDVPIQASVNVQRHVAATVNAVLKPTGNLATL